MSNIGGLPNLNNKRLTILQKQLNSTRKSITIVNDKLKESLERLEKSVDKRKQSDSFRSWQKTIPVKNSLVEMKALKKCLRRRRESTTLEPELTPRNGVYDGATLDSMKPEVNHLIAYKAPTQRRLRKVEKLKTSGYEDGRLVDYHDTLSKLHTVLSRPKAQAPRAPFSLSPRKTLLRQERNLLHQDEDEDEEEDEDDYRSPSPLTEYPSESEAAESGAALSEGPRTLGLQLPPIQAMASRRQSNFEKSLPSTCRNQASKQLPNLVRRVSSFGPY